MKIPNLEYRIKKIKDFLGLTDISSIGDGTVSGAISSQSDQIANVATVITSTTNNSGHAIYSGEYFIANGAKYKASATIDTGATWSDKSVSVSDHDLVNVLNSKITEMDTLFIKNTATRVSIDGTYTFSNQFVAPYDGVICARVDSSATIGLQVGNIYAVYPSPNTGVWQNSLPVKKGTHIYWVGSTYDSTKHRADFYYSL